MRVVHRRAPTFYSIFTFRFSLPRRRIGTAAVAKAMSNYLDSLLGSPQRNYMKTHFPINVDFLGEYPDVASFLFIMSIARN